MSQQDMDRLRAAIEDRLSWSPYESVKRARAEVVDVAADMLAELLWLHAEAVWQREQETARASAEGQAADRYRDDSELALWLYAESEWKRESVEASRRGKSPSDREAIIRKRKRRRAAA